MSYQQFVDPSQTLFQTSCEPQLHPHAKENCNGVEEKPANAQREEKNSGYAGEKKPQKNAKSQSDPTQKNAFIADVVERESVVRRESLHGVYVFFNCQLKFKSFTNLTNFRGLN